MGRPAHVSYGGVDEREISKPSDGDSVGMGEETN
jgi:hypothetical protein